VYETTQAPSQPGDELDIRLLAGGEGRAALVLKVRVLPMALLLTALQLLITGWRLSRSWFYQDDLNILATAAHRPLTPSLLLSNYNGHLVPASWAIAWVFDRIAPLQWWPAALLTFVITAANDVMLLALLRRLFGDRPAILFPYAMFCATTLTLTSTVWWAAALQWLPVSLSLLAALWFHVGYLQTGRGGDALGALVAVVFGLAFFEKALTTPLVLALFTVAYAVPGRLWVRPWRAFRRNWLYWLAHAALAGGFIALYLSRVQIKHGPTPKTSAMLETARVMIFDTFLPSLIGGPLNWFTTPASSIGSWPHPPVWLSAAGWILTLIAVLGSLILVRGAWRAWVLLAIFVAISVGLVVWARLSFVGPFIGRDHRYLTDAAVMAPLCLALAWIPLGGGLDAVLDGDPSRRPAPRRERRDAARRAWLNRHRALTGATAALAILAITAGGIVSGEKFMDSWTKNPSQAYIETLQHDLAAHDGPVYLFPDGAVPDLVMVPTFEADRGFAHITQPMSVRPVVRNAVPSFSLVDPRGHLIEGTVRGSKAVIPTPVCATPTKAATVLLPASPAKGQWKLELGYFTNRQTSARVSVGPNPPVSMRLDRGLHDIYVNLPVAGGSPVIKVDGLDLGGSVCVGTATLGLAVPK
jgi:hypothetical protein